MDDAQGRAPRRVRDRHEGGPRRRPDDPLAGVRPLPRPREVALARPDLGRGRQPLLRGRRAPPPARRVREARAPLRFLRDAPRRGAPRPQRLSRELDDRALPRRARREDRRRRAHLQAPGRPPRRRPRCQRRLPPPDGRGARRERVGALARCPRPREGLAAHLPPDPHRPDVQRRDEDRGPVARDAPGRHRPLRPVPRRDRARERAPEDDGAHRGARGARPERRALRLDDEPGHRRHGAQLRSGRRRRSRGSDAQALRQPRRHRRALRGAPQGAAHAGAVRVHRAAWPRSRSGWAGWLRRSGRRLRPERHPRPHPRGAAQGVPRPRRRQQERQGRRG